MQPSRREELSEEQASRVTTAESRCFISAKAGEWKKQIGKKQRVTTCRKKSVKLNLRRCWRATRSERRPEEEEDEEEEKEEEREEEAVFSGRDTDCVRSCVRPIPGNSGSDIRQSSFCTRARSHRALPRTRSHLEEGQHGMEVRQNFAASAREDEVLSRKWT